ncbi:MAG TPA: toll/interleukin-1 receptor domain-containing protein, partial [Terriglobia bacterium]|nr:toll/interleukin-1 receptor domain-containing protein [Terriglobia bacterium]
MPHDVFISYVEEDRAAANQVCEALESQEIRCWIAPRDITPGLTWGTAIIEAINASSVMVLIFSSHTNVSRQVVRELERADHKGVRIVPFRIENVPPSGDIEYFLGSIQWLDAFSGAIETQYKELGDALRTLLKKPAPPTVPGKLERSETKSLSEERILDAALPAQVPVEKPTELVVMVRRTDSRGLRAVLAVEDGYLATEEDVKSKPFQLEFALNAEGEATAAELTLRVDSPDFEPKSQQKKILVPPRNDSEAYVFLLTPKFKGQLVVNLEVYKRDLAVASRVLKTHAETSEREILSRAAILVSIPLYVVSCAAMAPAEAGVALPSQALAKSASGGEAVVSVKSGVRAETDIPVPSVAPRESFDDTKAIKVADIVPLPARPGAPKGDDRGAEPDLVKPPSMSPLPHQGHENSRPFPPSRKKGQWIAGTGAIAALFFCTLVAYFQISRTPPTDQKPIPPKGEAPTL